MENTIITMTEYFSWRKNRQGVILTVCHPQRKSGRKRYIENKSISQIAKDENTTENAVSKRLSRARNKIKSETGK